MKTQASTLIVILAFLLFAFCVVQTGQEKQHRKTFKPLYAEEYESAQDGALEYAAYEFNLLKDPVTGTIPNGTYAEEWQQALATEKHSDVFSNAHAKTEVIGTWNFKGPNNLGGRTRAIG